MTFDAPLNLPVTTAVGLPSVEAQQRLAREGYNELPSTQERNVLRLIVEALREPMLALLLAGGTIYLILGDMQEALILLAFAVFSIAIGVVQETRTERVLQALRDLTSPRALVIRDGARQRIAGREIVRGDLIVLAEGDRVPADGVLLEALDLQADESLLTGESVPVSKHVGTRSADQNAQPGGNGIPYVFSGSLIVRGNGIAEVIATGTHSEIGKIGQSIAALEVEPPRLRHQTQSLVRMFGYAGGFVSLTAILLYGLFRGEWIDALLAGIALGMSMLPEEFPVVLSVFMAMGAWRISRARVLTRRAAAIETLGAATVLCTDKTGTLTENRMSVVELRHHDQDVFRIETDEVPEKFHDLVRFAILASATNPFDPMEKALHAIGSESIKETIAPKGKLTLVHAYGLRPELLAVTHAWAYGDQAGLLVAAKGAPETIALLSRLPEDAVRHIKQAADEMAAKGLRVLGVARARQEHSELPETPLDFAFEFLGLVGLEDPLRLEARQAVAECRSAGIRVIMITGDYPATARAIAQQAGIDASSLMTGEELRLIGDDRLRESVREVHVFTRIMPEQKLRIVNALKGGGDIVAMTGDGVNDAPALKSAHIGIAMGRRGTDVAREASAIVLLEDDFGSIVKAVRLGRRIYDNLRKATAFIFAVHVPIAGLALLPLIFGLPVIFSPIHIAFLEMVIDPVCTLVFEAEEEEEDVMLRPPRRPEQPLFSSALVFWSVLQGFLAFGLVAAIYVMAYRARVPETEARALAFFSLIMAIVALIFVNRSFGASIVTALRRPNHAFKFVLTIVAIVLGTTLTWPYAAGLFKFGPLHADDLLLTAALGILVLVVLEALKPRWAAKLRG